MNNDKVKISVITILLIAMFVIIVVTTFNGCESSPIVPDPEIEGGLYGQD